MVISVGSPGTEGSVQIPSVIARAANIPTVVDEVVVYQPICDGDYGFLVRQPCLWPGGIQPVRVQITEPHIVTTRNGAWDVNFSLRMPPGMCSPYAADFDGDEMSFFPVKETSSVLECKSFQWDYTKLNDSKVLSQLTPRTQHDRNKEFQDMFIRSTICWSDRKKRGFKITEAHKVSQLTVSSFISFGKPHQDALSFARTANSSMTLAASKSSHQSDIGALSRRSKLGAERIVISASGCLGRLSSLGIAPVAMNLMSNQLVNIHKFGNPTVRAISKLSSRIMQITLKVKSTQSIQASSPTLTFLAGSLEWLALMDNATVRNQSPVSCDLRGVKATTSIWHISTFPASERFRLCKGCVHMCVAETGVVLSPVEFESLVQLAMYCVEDDPSPTRGISINTFCEYPDMPILWRWNACYYDAQRGISHSNIFSANSAVERRFLGNFDTLPGISEYFRSGPSIPYV